MVLLYVAVLPGALELTHLPRAQLCHIISSSPQQPAAQSVVHGQVLGKISTEIDYKYLRNLSNNDFRSVASINKN